MFVYQPGDTWIIYWNMTENVKAGGKKSIYVTMMIHNECFLISPALQGGKWKKMNGISFKCMSDIVLNWNALLLFNSTFKVVTIFHCPRGDIWDEVNSFKTIPRFPEDSHLSMTLPLGSYMTKERQLSFPIRKLFQTETRNLPAERFPLSLHMDACLAEQIQL